MADTEQTEKYRPEVAGIDQAAEPCWFPATPDGMAFEWGDGCPHWKSEGEGRERIAAIIEEIDAPSSLVLTRESKPCWHLTCAECEYRYDEDEWVSHFGSKAEAKSNAEDCDWHVIEKRLLCHECAFDRPTQPECDACKDTGRVPWMVEADPNCYQEPDDDGTMPCLDCRPTRPGGGR